MRRYKRIRSTRFKVGTDLEALNKVLQTLKEGFNQLSLSTAQGSELEAEIKTLEAQIASPKPKHTSVVGGESPSRYPTATRDELQTLGRVCPRDLPHLEAQRCRLW